jgi:hypothetical protein
MALCMLTVSLPCGVVHQIGQRVHVSYPWAGQWKSKKKHMGIIPCKPNVTCGVNIWTFIITWKVQYPCFVIVGWCWYVVSLWLWTMMMRLLQVDCSSSSTWDSNLAHPSTICNGFSFWENHNCFFFLSLLLMVKCNKRDLNCVWLSV